MQKAPLVLIVLVVVAGAAAATPLAFDTPGEFRAAWLGAHGGSWALLVFKNGTAADFRVQSSQPATLTNETEIFPTRIQRDDDSWILPTPEKENSTATLPAPLQFQASFLPEHSGSLFIMAERMEFNLHDADGVLSARDAQHATWGFTRSGDLQQNLYRSPQQDLGPSVLIAAHPPASQGGSFNLAVQGASYLEWYNAQTTCTRQGPCPGGGGPEITPLPGPPGFKVTSERHTYEVLKSHGIELQGRGTLDYVLYGSSILDLGINGAVRLPLAAAEGTACQGCAAPKNQTFGATGNITFKRLQMSPNGLQAEIGGEIDTARFDEVAIDPASLFAGRTALAGAAVLGGGFLLLKLVKLLWPALFTRQREDEALNNDRRRQLHDVIGTNPGISIREALRLAGMRGIGAGRHHITKLVQAGLVVERRHRNSLRLFPNDPKFRDGWQEVAVLSDPHYRLLHDWIRDNPGKAQNEIVAAFAAAHGWRRGVTRLRVERLLAEGLLQFREQGRCKLYFPVPMSPPVVSHHRSVASLLVRAA